MTPRRDRPDRPGPPMTYLAERVADLRRQLAHLEGLRSHVPDPAALEADLSLANDVRYGLLVVCQRAIDIAGELSARRGLRFEDYIEAVRNLAIYEEFPDALIRRLEPLPALRNSLVHASPPADSGRVFNALAKLESVQRFVQSVARVIQKSPADRR